MRMRLVKILAGLVGGVIVLIVVGLVAVRFLVTPSMFKDRIAATVKESTGRDLVLTGDIKLSVFPWVALELGPATLSNPPGFGTEPFVAFNRAAVRVKLIPLLSQRLEIDRVDLDGFDLRLRKNAQGVGNWENFGPAKQPAAKDKNTKSNFKAQLAGIRLTNGRLSYDNIVVEKLNVDVGALGGKGVTPISIGFDAGRGVAGESLTLSAKFELDADAAVKTLRLAAVSLSGLVNLPGQAQAAHWELTAPSMDADFTAETLAVPSFAASFLNAHLTGKLQATKILSDLSANGSMALAPLVLREFAPRAGITLPKTTDPRALAQLSSSSDFSYGASGLRLTQVQAQLDDSHLKGSFALVGEPRVIKFDLNVDSINVDRYLSPAHGPAPGAPAEKPANAAKAGDAGKLPEANGTLSLGAVHFSPLDFSNVKVTLASKDNVLHLFPAQAQIDGGNYAGNITVDERAATPNLSIDEHLSGVDMAQLLAATSYKGRLSGRGNVNIKATARGAAYEAVMQTLNGHFDANLVGGAIEGVDLGFELARAQALYKQTAVPTRSNPPRTQFDAFKMSAEILNGVANTKDLTIASPILKVSGQGSANLVNKAIDLQMMASVLKSPGVSAADIPVKVTGTYVDPTIRPDVEGLAKNEVKQRLQDVLKKNGLDKLFSR